MRQLPRPLRRRPAPTGCPDPEVSALESRLLDLVGLLAFLLGLRSPWAAWRDGAGWMLLCLVLLLGAFVFWLIVRRGGPPQSAWGLLLAVTALSLVPGAAPASALLLLVAVMVVGLEAGFVPALVSSVLVVFVLIVSLLFTYHPSTSDTLSQSVGLGVLLVVAASIGGLLRGLDEARSTVIRRSRDLEQANARLQEAVVTERELVLAQERARSARELHDGLGHRLTLVAMGLQFARKARESAPQRAWDEIEHAAQVNQEALDLMRVWVRALDPPAAEPGVGGAAAFDGIAQAFRGTGLEIDVRHHGSQAVLPPDLSVFATRLVQEGLTNVVRHAHASVAEVDIVQSEHQVRIALRDNGVGVTVPHEGFGLKSLRERALALGGSLTTQVLPRGGFELAAVLPIGSEGI